MKNDRASDLTSVGIRAARVLLALLIALTVAIPAARAAEPDPVLETALARLAADSFADTGIAIGEIAASGAPQAADILNAMADRRLFLDPATGAVLIKPATGTGLVDARTGASVDPSPEGLKPVRLNNRLRGDVAAALGTLTLRSPDPVVRRAAADTVFKSRDEAALPALDKAIAAETDPAIRRALEAARGSVLLNRAESTAEDKIAAIDLVAARGDQDALGALRSALATVTDPEVKVALQSGIGRVEQRLAFVAWFQNVWYGLSLGSVLLLAAIGLAITFGVMGVINMAHGEMVMLGAYTTFVVQEAFRTYAPQAFDLSLPVAIPLAFLVAGGVGVAIERGIIRFLYGRPLETLLATWGVSLILQQAVRTTFGPTNREVGNPSYMSGAFDLFGLSITYGRLWIIVFTLIVFAGLLVALKATPLGLQMRAVTQNRRMAASMGIRTGYVDAMTFGLGSGVAGIAGVALSQIDNVSPNLGQAYIIDSFMVVVFGGVGNLWGALVSAFALGIGNKFLEPTVGAVLAKILILVALILFIQKRPRGLFALKGRAIET